MTDIYILLSLSALPPYMMRHTGWRGVKRADSLTHLLINSRYIKAHPYPKSNHKTTDLAILRSLSPFRLEEVGNQKTQGLFEEDTSAETAEKCE